MCLGLFFSEASPCEGDDCSGLVAVTLLLG